MPTYPHLQASCSEDGPLPSLCSLRTRALVVSGGSGSLLDDGPATTPVSASVLGNSIGTATDTLIVMATGVSDVDVGAARCGAYPDVANARAARIWAGLTLGGWSSGVRLPRQPSRYRVNDMVVHTRWRRLQRCCDDLVWPSVWLYIRSHEPLL